MKKIIRLTENDLAKIVRRVINERQYLMEGVLTTTLESTGPVTLKARTVCSTGPDYILVSAKVKNTGGEDAYLTNFPYLQSSSPTASIAGAIMTDNVYNVTINGKPSWGQADTQNAPKIPKNSTATLNFRIYTNIKEGSKTYEDYKTKLTNAKSANIVVRYNGASDLIIPVTIGGFTLSKTQACDAAFDLPKGF